jgi:hypothetical protein
VPPDTHRVVRLCEGKGPLCLILINEEILSA